MSDQQPTPPPPAGQPASTAPVFRPLEFGSIFSQSFTLLRQNPVPLLAVAGGLVFVLVTAGSLLTSVAQDATGLSAPEPVIAPDRVAGMLGLVFGAVLVQLVVSVAAQIIAQGFALFNLRAALLGDRASTGAIWRLLGQSWGRLLGVALVMLGIGLAFSVVFGTVMVLAIVAVTSATNPGAAAMIAIPVMFIIILAAMVPLCWLVYRLSLAPSIIVFERAGVRAALGRSWHLVRGRFWRVFGVQVLIGVIIGAVSTIIVFLVALISAVGALSSENLLTSATFATLMAIPAFAASACGAVVVGNATGLLYADARFREDWLATSLTNYAAARMSGVPATQLADPFVTPPAHLAPPAAMPPPPGVPPVPSPDQPHTPFPGN